MAEQPVSYLEPWQSLGDKVVMVTGASSGIGREFCVDLAKAGCRIIAAARRTERLHLLCDQINQFPSLSSFSSNSTSALGDSTIRAVAVELDVCADGLAIEASVQKAWNAFGRIDVLINNAGVRGSIRSPLHISEEEWNNTLKTNLTGAWLVSKYVCIRMRDAKLGGSIINISSIVGLNRGQLPGAVAYIASKSGLSALTKVIICAAIFVRLYVLVPFGLYFEYNSYELIVTLHPTNIVHLAVKIGSNRWKYQNY
ncbi:hypothetical protein Nepgr_022051 [Nepenthes gracilis]|uniref:Uncharacterized protein n=1 Tax=Nepenthes gracilis TaxID=150966 RepID=A0AAD3SYP6_NEPGR|nr:hypothetical protein Nepgr_022051 [Nepenthes gracilis]